MSTRADLSLKKNHVPGTRKGAKKGSPMEGPNTPGTTLTSTFRNRSIRRYVEGGGTGLMQIYRTLFQRSNDRREAEELYPKENGDSKNSTATALIRRNRTKKKETRRLSRLISHHAVFGKGALVKSVQTIVDSNLG